MRVWGLPLIDEFLIMQYFNLPTSGSLYLSIYPTVYLSVSTSIRISVCLSVCLLSICQFTNVGLSSGVNMQNHETSVIAIFIAGDKRDYIKMSICGGIVYFVKMWFMHFCQQWKVSFHNVYICLGLMSKKNYRIFYFQSGSAISRK